MTATTPERPVTLNDIDALYLRLDEALLASEGEITPEVDAALDLAGTLEKWKLDAYAFRIKALAQQATATETLRDELTGKMQRERNQVDWMKNRLLAYMEERHATKLEGAIYTLAIQNSAPRVELTVAEDQVPDTFVQMKPRIDLLAIKAALQEPPADASLPTLILHALADQIAKLTTGRHLRIR